MGAPAESAQPNLAAFAAKRGLYHRAPSMALPQATQLLRHGFMREVPSLVRGDLPGGLEDAWLAQVDYVNEGRSELRRHYFTVVVIEAPASLAFAVRVLCHDRSLSRLDMSNPDSDREVVEFDDRAVTLESAAFLERYALFVDNDQGELSVWRLFAPSLIDWLTVAAPADFSFELQDGALCCFVPGTLAADDEVEQLCIAAGRVLTEVSRIGSAGVASTVVDSRRSEVEERLAEHPFDQPPESVKAAAKAFRRGLGIGEEGWKLGAEAFFREHAAAAGMRRIDPAEFRASHLNTFFPGVLAHVARGSIGEPPVEAHLLLTDSEDFDGMGWSLIVADFRATMNRAAASRLPRGTSSERGEVKTSTDGRSLFLSCLDGGARGRTAEELRAFLVTCGSQLGA